MNVVNYRPGLGDDPGRYVRHEHGYIEWRMAPGHTCEVVNIEVDAAHRREGVGRKLVQQLFGELVAHFGSEAAPQVYAITRSDNEVAMEFYEAMGFRVGGVLRRFYSVRRGVDAVLFARSAGGPV